MVWRLCILFIGLASIGTCNDDEDDDWFESDRWSSVNVVSYGGISFTCDAGCGDIAADPNLRNIDCTMKECLGKTINKYPATYDLNDEEDFSISRPWSVNDNNCYSTLTRQAKNNKNYEIVPDENIFLETHNDLPNIMACFYEDLTFYHSQKIQHCNDHIAKGQFNIQQIAFLKKRGYSAVGYDEDDLICNWNQTEDIDQAQDNTLKEIANWEQEKQDEQDLFENYQALADEAFKEIDAFFKDTFMWCLTNHQPEGIAFNGALESFLANDFDLAIEQLRLLIQIVEERHMENDLLAKLYLLKGEVQAECCLYADAVIDLTSAIQKNPSMKEAYFNRAGAYFELGKFDEAIQDYIASNIRPFYPTSPTQMGLGIVAGLLEGGVHSVGDFAPSLLGSLRGLSTGLWAFAKHPVGASKEFVHAATQCIDYLRQHSNVEMLQDMVPEMREIIQHGNHLTDFKKGQLLGLAIGKYGVDIFLAKYIPVATKAYIELKKANQLMTLEALASPEQTQIILAGASQRWALRETVIKNGNFTFSWDKQGKHNVNHKNYKNLVKKGDCPSIFDHSDPERLIKEFAGTGIKDSKLIPGTSGYTEIVNFEEFIGYAVNKNSGERFPTTWGKIHYSKDGVHIVPRKPGID